MRYFWLGMLLTFVQAHARAALAAEVVFQSLASITNDRNADLQHVGVLLDAGEVVGLRFHTINGNNSHISDFSINDIKAGAVLDDDAKRKAIVLQGFIYSAGNNANLVITYLSNGLSRQHKVCYARIERDASGQWHIVDIYEHKWVDHLVIKTRRLGISTIQGICPG
jgi:hypothetical protein